MPPRFAVRLTPSFQRDLEELPASVQDKILEAIKRLETNPFGPPPRIKKLKGKGIGQWRLEVANEAGKRNGSRGKPPGLRRATDRNRWPAVSVNTSRGGRRES